MNPSENLPRETEPGESWLRSMLPAAEQVDGTAIKQRIRVELGERWLKGELRNGDTTRTVVAARNRVHEQLAADQRLDSPLRSTRRRIKRWIIGLPAGLATAAALVIVSFGWLQTVTQDTGSGFVELSEFAEDGVLNFDDLDVAIDELRAKFDAADGTLAINDEPFDEVRGWFNDERNKLDGSG
ncbi:MAG: hypothetical protein AABZ12_13390 [Planctomycetota bacterium]